MPEQEYFEYTGGEPFSINMRAPRNTATRYASGPTPPKLPARRRMLFCDLDGVLADFDGADSGIQPEQTDQAENETAAGDESLCEHFRRLRWPLRL